MLLPERLQTPRGTNSITCHVAGPQEPLKPPQPELLHQTHGVCVCPALLWKRVTVSLLHLGGVRPQRFPANQV